MAKFDKVIVDKVIVTEVQGMDKFSFIMENDNGNGRMSIDTTSGAFSYLWGSMGYDTVQEFILSTNDDYLAKCFLRGITDEDERAHKYYALEKALKNIRTYLENNNV